MSKSAVSPEDLLDAGDFISEFSSLISTKGTGLTGSAAETATARLIRDRLHEETGAPVRLEAFRAEPLLGRGCFPFLGLWFALSLLLYFISFAGGKVAGIWLTLLALVVFIAGGAVLISLFLGRRTFAWLLGSRVSYNVVSEKEATVTAEGARERAIVIADNHDAVMGSYFNDFAAFRKAAFILAPVCAFIFVLFCIIKMAIGSDTAAKISVLTIIPAIAGVIGIFVIIAHFSPFEQHLRQNNGVSVSAAMAAYAYFAENPELIPEGVKLVYVSLGAENSGHCGSEAFMRAHPEFKNAAVLAIGDIKSGALSVAECDSIRKIKFSTAVVSDIRSSAHEQDIRCDTVRHDSLKYALNSLNGYISDAFAKRGAATATILAKDYNGSEENVDRSDTDALFSLAVGTIFRLFNENIPENDTLARKKDDGLGSVKIIKD